MFEKNKCLVFSCISNAAVFLCALLFIYLNFSQLSLAQSDDSARPKLGEAFLSSLTASERTWLKQNTIVRYTGNSSRLPFETFDSNGEYTGIAAEYIQEVSRITGLEFVSVEPSRWESAEDLFQKGKVRLISGDLADKKLNLFGKPTSAFIRNKILIVTQKDTVISGELQYLRDITIGVVNNVGYADDMNIRYPFLTFVEYDKADTLLEAIESKDIDAALMSRAQVNYLMNLGYHKDLVFRGASGLTMETAFFVTHSVPELRDIINKALTFISETRKSSILSNWVSPRDPIISGLSVHLTQAERQYLSGISPIPFAGNPDFLPYEGFNDRGEYVGAIAEYLALIEALLEIKFDVKQTQGWEESVDLARQGDVLVLSETQDSLLRNEMIFTQTYTDSAMITVMREGERFTSRVADVKDRKIALLQGYENAGEVEQAYPRIDFQYVSTISEGMFGVSSGEFDVFIVSAAQAHFYINSLGLNNIKISGTTEFKTKLTFAVSREHKKLAELIDRALDQIMYSPQQQKIFNTWSQTRKQSPVNKQLIYKIIAAFMVICGFGFFWVYRLKKDILRRKIIENELAAAKEMANSANQAKTRFLANMSHELRTPMNGILGLLELLRSTGVNEEQRGLIKLTERSSKNLLLILNDILDLSKIEAEKIEINNEPMCLKDLIEDCVSVQALNAYSKGLNVDLFIEPMLEKKIISDPFRIRQVLTNLLSNAIKFTSHGSVTIKAHARVLERKDYVSSKDYLDIRISVADTGIGIDAQKAELLFNDFVQADSGISTRFGGTGLGLSISRRLTELMGGKLKLKSKKDEGTKVSLCLKCQLNDNNEKPSEPWSGVTIIVVTSHSAVVRSIDQYVNYNGARCFAPIVPPPDTESLAQLIGREKADIVIVDKALFDLHYDNARTILLERTGSPCKSIIQLAGEANLSGNEFDRGVSVLNTNPLQPKSLARLVNVGLGIEKHAKREVSSGKKIEQKNITLLVVDDHPINRAVISRQLSHLGYQFDTADDGQQALTKWHEKAYDGLVTDCHMPVMDGYDLARAIRKRDSDVPIIAVTANAMSGERERCLAAGMNDIIIKPVALEEMSDMLRNWFAQEGVDISIPPIREPDANEDGLSNEDVPSNEDVLSDEVVQDSFLLSLFWKTMDNDLTLLHQHVLEGQIDKMSKTAHRIKGAARSAGAHSMGELSAQLEKNAENMTDKERKKCVYALEGAYKRLKNHHNV